MAETVSVTVVEDEKSLRDSLVLALTESGFQVRTFGDGKEACESILADPGHILILDIMLPRMDGITLCRRLRETGLDTPVIFLSSRDSEEDKIDGLLSGGDDYMTKPFSMRELLTRINVCIRRMKRIETKPLEIIAGGSLKLYPESWTAEIDGSELTFTVSEFRILSLLCGRKGRVFTREQLLDAAYPDDRYISDRNADAHIRRIRKKIRAVSSGYDEIETVYGIGYRYRS